ncbi:MAG: hypothetical protein GY928_22580 [Colwellia sp.]|nr:hypothetical protein [Colwellia sp.]
MCKLINWRDQMKDYSSMSYAVEANSFETMCLWEKYKDDVVWVDEGRGIGVTVKGRVDTFLSLTSVNIQGVDVIIYEATSVLVDHKAVEDYLLDLCPALTTHNMTNSMNFPNIVHSINRGET